MDPVPRQAKASRRVQRAGTVRHSVNLPAQLAVQVRRLAKERHLTLDRAVVSMVARGVHAELSEKEHLEACYDRFMSEKNPARREDAGKDLIRAIFGKDAICRRSGSLIFLVAYGRI